MPRTVFVSPDGLPDVNATLHDDGTWQCSVTMREAFARIARPAPRERLDVPRLEVHVVRLRRRRS